MRVCFTYVFLFVLLLLFTSIIECFQSLRLSRESLALSMSSYFEDLTQLGKSSSEKKCLVGLTTDAWNVGQKKYKDFLAVHKMYKKVQKANIACVEIPMWEISQGKPRNWPTFHSLHILTPSKQGPHFDDLQRLFESFWIPDMTSSDQLLLQFDLTIIPGN